MGIIFKIRDFAYPFSILRLKRMFDRNQWLEHEDLIRYQSARLREIVAHAYEQVPYYHELLKHKGMVPSDIRTAEDLQNLPMLSKELLRENFQRLIARNARKYRPVSVATSGATGTRTDFYCDKPSNILEFVYYWRFWQWAGYRLGDTFADLDVEFFPYYSTDRHCLFHHNPLTGKLTLNSLLLSRKRADDFIGILRKFRPRFIKGIPSNLFMLALILNERKERGISFRAVFSQGEMLMSNQREIIEKTFSCKIFDSYGQMERVVAVSQCPAGTYHLHEDYGVAEFEDPEFPVAQDEPGTFIKEIIGTSLHNFSMPLIRYRTRDYVKISQAPGNCTCGRGFTPVVSIIGRDADIIITPDKRAVAGLYLVFDHTPGILGGQIIQEEIDRLAVKIVSESSDYEKTGKILMENLQNIVGNSMRIAIERTTAGELLMNNSEKFRVVISRVPYERIMEQ